MTPEQIEARFQRIEGLLMEATELALKNQRQQEALNEQQERTQTQLAELTHDFRSGVEDLVEFGMQTLNAVEVMQSEVRGLQVENRRILRELRDRREGA
jgi:hypothetical protein